MRKQKYKWLVGLVMAASMLSTTVFAAQTPTPFKNGNFKIPENTYIVNQKSVDVSGDRKPDTVTLIAQKDDKDSPRVEQLYLLVEDKANKKYMQVALPDSFGFAPSIGFYEFNKDKIMEIMVALPTGGSSGSISYYIYSFKNNKATALFLPNEASTPEFKGKFVSNYSVVITSKKWNRAFTIDLKDRKKIYDEVELYRNGKLLRSQEIGVDYYYNLYPIDIDKDGSYELRGEQLLYGVAHADTIAKATSTWKWDKSKWKLTDVKVVRVK